MNMKFCRGENAFRVFVSCGLLAATGPAWAALGAQTDGWSTILMGMGGAGIANPVDAVAAADNPAGMSKIGNEFDLGGMIGTLDENNTYLSPGNKLTGYKFLPLLDGGFNYQLNPLTTVGVSFFGMGAGGLYDQRQVPVQGLGNASALVGAVFVSPTVTRKITDSLALGFTINLVTAALDGQNLMVPNGSPVSPDLSTGFSELPNHGLRLGYGVGFSVGALWDVLPNLSFGASYRSKTAISSFSGYSQDLLASTGGHIDFPEEYGVGVKWNPIRSVTLAADYLRINWGNCRALGDPGLFGWKNINVGRFGAAWDINSKWTVRTGFTLSNYWTDTAHAATNVLAPVTTDQSVSAGATYRIDKNQAVSFAFDYGIPNKKVGTGPSQGVVIDTNTNFYTFQYSRRF